jgi:hypothetical protein
MAANVQVGKGLLDTWHVAGDTFSAGATWLMMRMFLERAAVRTVWRARAVTFEADQALRFD